MLAEVSKAFSPTFLVGHLLPSILFVAFVKFVLGMPAQPSLVIFLESLKSADDIVDIGVLGLLLGIFLATLNRDLVQFYEGYWLGGVFKFRFAIGWDLVNERLRYDRLTAELAAAQSGTSGIQIQLAQGFPERRDLVLPTRFGNTIRAFERYSSVAYGFEAVEGSNRLDPLMEEHVRTAISWSKMKLDFWINVGSLSLFAPFVWWWGVWQPSACVVAGSLVAAVVACFLAIHMARRAAYEWGVNMKSGIDLTLPKLAKTLGYDIPEDAAEQRRFWTALTQHFLLRDDRTLALLAPYRAKKPPEEEKD